MSSKSKTAPHVADSIRATIKRGSIRDLTVLETAVLSTATPALITSAKRILCNYPTVSVDCEDVVQEVMYETIKKLTQGEEIANLDAYMRVAVVNRSINRAKSLNRSRGILFELDNGFSGYLITADQDQRVDLLVEKRELFKKCRDLLEEREQLVLDMLVEGFASRNIAEALSLQTSHVYVITHRLRRKFNYLLSEKIAAT